MLLNGESNGQGKKIGGKPMVVAVIAVLAEKSQEIRSPRVRSLWLQPRPLRKRPSEFDVSALTSTFPLRFPPNRISELSSCGLKKRLSGRSLLPAVWA